MPSFDNILQITSEFFDFLAFNNSMHKQFQHNHIYLGKIFNIEIVYEYRATYNLRVGRKVI